jgi:YbbR domain-containing protein
MKILSFLSRLSKIIFQNWQAKLGSFLLASLFYLNLQSSKILVKTIEIPIEYPRIPITWNYSKLNEKTIKVKVEGFKDLVNYHSQFMKVIIDPNDINVGENIIEIKKIWGTTNKIRVTPEVDKIVVQVEHSISKTVPVDILFEDDLPNTFVRTSFSIKPNNVTLTGPSAILDSINKYTLGTISLKDSKESFTKTFKPVNLPKGVNLTTKIKDFQVKVNIQKGATEIGEQFYRIPVKCEYLDSNLTAELSVDEVSLKFNSQSKISSSELLKGIRATVACNYLYDSANQKIMPSSTAMVKVKVQKDQNLKSIDILSILPEKVRVTYKLRKKVFEEVDSYISEDPAFDNIIYPDEIGDQPRMQ